MFLTKEQIHQFSNEELLSQLIESFDRFEDYLHKADWIQWSQEAQDQVAVEYNNIYYEVLKRMKKNDN